MGRGLLARGYTQMKITIPTNASPAAKAALTALQTGVGPVAAKVGAPAIAAFVAYGAANPRCPVAQVAMATLLLGKAPNAKQKAAVAAYMAAPPMPVLPCGSKQGAGLPYGAHVALALPRKPMVALPVSLPHGQATTTVPATNSANPPRGKALALAAQACSVAGLTPATSHAIYGNGYGAGLQRWLAQQVATYGGTLAGRGTSGQWALPKGSAVATALVAAQATVPVTA